MSESISAAGLRTGLILTLPLLPGVAVFGASFGAVAARTGLSLIEAVMMSAAVFAGASQFAGLSAWQTEWTLTGVLTVILLVAVVNSRLILTGATLRPWFEHMPDWKACAFLVINTDSTWLLSLRAETETGRRDLGVFVGVGLSLWVVWVASTIPGWWLGAIIADPRAYALDMVMIVFFAAMLVPLWKGPRRARPWVVAGAVSLLVYWLVPGPGYVLAGALSGAAAGAILDD